MWHWIVLECTYYFVHPLYADNVDDISERPELMAAARLCFLFDIQQLTVSVTDGSVLQRAHRGNVSRDDATHGALLKLLSYLQSGSV